MARNSMAYQHQPVRIPAGWTGQDRAMVIQVDDLFDDVYRKLGGLGKNETTEIRGSGGDAIGYVAKTWDKAVALLQGKNDTFPAAGIALPEKYAAAEDFYACCRYTSGNTNAIGMLMIAKGTSTLKLLDMSGTATTGTNVAGEITYILRNT